MDARYNEWQRNERKRQFWFRMSTDKSTKVEYTTYTVNVLIFLPFTLDNSPLVCISSFAMIYKHVTT